MEGPLEVYIPMDRRQALARGQTLPDRAEGAALVADISGFTALTEALIQELGPRHGIDELSRQLNLVYEGLISQVHRLGGSVITFSGDAILCWFNDDNGLRAVTCALAMQRVMNQFVAIRTPAGAVISLAIKVAVTAGPARRFLVGDPQIQYIDVLAGSTLDRLDLAEDQARQGEVIVGLEVVDRLGPACQVVAWRQAAGSEQRFALVAGLKTEAAPAPWPPLRTGDNRPVLGENQIRPWLLPPVYARLKAGQGAFLAELRPAVAMFVRFGGLDYDRDDQAGQKLDAYVRWVQNMLAYYEGSLIQLVTGDKGSYLYAAFGAPVAHGDDAVRAVAAALMLQALPPGLRFITGVQIGLSQGRMRTGAYGSATQRTFGVLGDEVNVAARLMSQARPGQPLVSKKVAEAAARNYYFNSLGTVEVKGKQEPIPVFGVSTPRWPVLHTSPQGRDHAEILRHLDQVLATVQDGQGHVFRVETRVGVGAGHLVTDFIQQALHRNFQVARASSQSSDQNAGLAPWRQMLLTWFDLVHHSDDAEDPAARTARQISHLETVVADINPDWLAHLPILGDLLNLPIPDNASTASFDPQLRQSVQLALLLEVVKTWVHNQPSLMVLEGTHRLDPASQRLTLAVARSLADMPALLLLVNDTLESEALPLFADLEQLPYYHYFNLQDRIEAVLIRRAASPKQPEEPASQLVGRAEERLVLAGQLQALARIGASGTTIIEGEAGIGKSRLVEDLLDQAQTLGITCLLGAGNPTERSTAYHAWRPIFRQLFNLDGRSNENTLARRTSVLSSLPTSPELLRLLPLLNVVLPLGLQENDLTRQMTGQVRADNTRDLLLHLLQTGLGGSPTLLILEDAHWLDSASWALARLASQQLQPLLLIIVTRPPAEPAPVEYSQFIRAAGSRRLLLHELSPQETVSLIGQCLEVKRVPEAVAKLIYTRAEGHPFFSIELAYTLRDAELIRVVDGECQTVPDLERMDSGILPDTIEGAVTTRIDRLNYQQQLTLKVASVIGLTFLYRLLHDVHPVTADRQYLPDYLANLEKLNITHKEAPDPDLAYTFQHVIIREVAYNLMPFDQRRELHQAVARWLEQTYASDLASFYPLLAHHWRVVAGEQPADETTVARAIYYLEKAGEQALNGYANKEAARFFSELLKLDARLTTGAADGGQVVRSIFGRPARQVRRARWERQLGETYLGLGQLAESQKHFERAAKLIGWPRPAGRLGYGLGLLGQILRQARHRLWPVSLVKRSPQAQATWLEAARIHERLGEVAYWSNQTIPTVYAALQTLNLAERAQPSPELVRAYASICIAAGFVSLDGLADTYRRRAMAAAESLHNRPAQVWVLELTGVHALGAGRWDQARQALSQAVAICDQIQDRRRWAECLAALNEVDYFQGKFGASLDVWPSIYASASRRDDPQARSWGLTGQLRSLLALDRLDSDQASAALAGLEALLGERIGAVDEMGSYGIVAQVRLRLGQYGLARQAIEAVMRHIGPAAPTVFSVIHGYISLAEVYMALWEAGRPDETGAGDLGLAARQACQALHRYARVFQIGQPRAWLYQGRLEWQSGRPARAFRAWHKSLAMGQRLAMPYEQGLAHYQIGRHLQQTDPRRSVHLARAQDIFAGLNAGYDLARTHALLAG